ncbi:DUF4142 domain-containing protein [Caenimonas terrae]|uniref:DUF4142 domain-containing protein n=1 Tax=Caenimonas terrae TaxID=696074 RepID=A0ABW0NJD7_9BURK
MKTFYSNALAAALAAAFAAGGALAQSNTPGGNGPSVSTTVPATPGAKTAGVKPAKVAHGDRKFMTKVAAEGMYEVEVAKLAAGKASSPELKTFANMMVDDHTKANAELAQLAGSRGVELPAALSHGQRRDLEKMGKRSGDQFDREFAKEVGLKDHKKDIKAFEKESGKAKDPELKAWVDKTLPTLRAHLDAATKLPQNQGKG